VYAVDSRIELYPASIWADYDTVESGTGACLSVLNQADVSLVVTETATNSRLESALSGAGWGRVFSDADGSVWGRPGDWLGLVAPAALR
jgi:hypothetical protein